MKQGILITIIVVVVIAVGVGIAMSGVLKETKISSTEEPTTKTTDQGETTGTQESATQGEGTTEEEATKTEEPTETTLDCPVGTWTTSGNSKYKVTGIEKYDLGGKSVSLCCAEATSEDGSKAKYCGSGDTYITWETDSETGKFYKSGESYTQDGKPCYRQFDPDGSVTAEGCF